jgi:hypothetical protein
MYAYTHIYTVTAWNLMIHCICLVIIYNILPLGLSLTLLVPRCLGPGIEGFHRYHNQHILWSTHYRTQSDPSGPKVPSPGIEGFHRYHNQHTLWSTLWGISTIRSPHGLPASFSDTSSLMYLGAKDWRVSLHVNTTLRLVIILTLLECSLIILTWADWFEVQQWYYIELFSMAGINWKNAS